MADRAPRIDSDLDSIREARQLARRARAAQTRLAELTQEQVDRIVGAAAQAAAAQAAPLARMAVEETGYGNEADKVRKNLFAAETIHRFIEPMRTVGVIRRLEAARVVEIAEPFGVVAAVVPSTNPTSTAIYKILVCLKARCAVVLSPHPAAARCVRRVAEVMTAAAGGAGMPDDAVTCMTTVTLEGTQELMRRREVALILATGGLGLVRAAYSAGKPAYGVGPGNAPAYIERTADLPKAVADVITGKTFDNGLLCSSENSVVVDEAVAGEVRREFERQGGYFLNASEAHRLAAALVTADRLPSPELVGRTAAEIAARTGIDAPAGTRVLVAPLEGVGRDHPLSIEKLCPVLSFYVVADWRAGCERCMEILRYGGMGHTMAIHSQDEQVILEFGLRKPAFRIVVNTPTTLGSIGMTTGLDPSMTLGCGGHGGNITSDNITPRHLLNVKRLAWEVRPADRTPRDPAADTAAPAAPTPPTAARPGGGRLDPALLTRRIDAFLAGRGVRAASSPAGADPMSPNRPGAASSNRSANADALPAEPPPPPAAPAATVEGNATETDHPVDFVCESDVRQAVESGRRIAVDERTIITPAARDLGEPHGVFRQA
ncbi:MAG: aldehyde dehydrogenase family protein [Acidobacteria bacterium]|nr:aldehyde dehydrogenase family protein [Acidobacteriota bacterium]